MNLDNIKIQNIENSELLQQYFDNLQKEIAGNEVSIQMEGKRSTNSMNP